MIFLDEHTGQRKIAQDREKMTMPNEMVSVVITTYKREDELLRRSIESVLNQTHRNLELIVVDDNEKDDIYQRKSEKIVQSYKGIKYIQNGHNMGAQYSRNIGILNSLGEYLAFLDDDDEWDPLKLEKQLEKFTEECVGLVYCNGYTSVDGKKSEYRYWTTQIDPSFSDMLGDDFVGSTSQVLIKKKCFAHVGIFDNDMPARQDYEMWIRISQKYKLVCVEDRLFTHYMHEGEQISKNPTKALTGYTNIFKKYKTSYRKERKAKAKILKKIASNLFKCKKPLKGSFYLLRSFLACPKETIGLLKGKKQQKI